MANYKIKDLQQASSLNGAIAFEIQDGNNKSTFATLDQIAEFLGNDTPVVLRVKRSGEGGYLPDMTIAEITAAYAKIVADPVHNIPVVSIPDAGGQYLLPSGYNTNVGLNSILGHYYSQNYVQPYVLELTNSAFTFGRNGGNKDVKIGELAVSSGVPIAYMDIADGDTSENISDIVGGPVSFHETCNALKLSTIAAGFRFSNGVKTVYIPIATDVSISGDVYTLSLEYEKEAVVTRLQVREQNGVFSASRTDYSIPDLETDFTEQLSRLEIALRANGSDLVYSSPRVVIEASESRSNYVEVPIGAVAVDDKLSLSLGLIKITSGAPSGFSFVLVDAAGTSIANVLMLQGQLTGTFTVRTTASDARLRLFAGKDGSTAGAGVEYDTVMLVRGDIPASALSLLDVLNRSKTYTDGIAAGKADLDPSTGCVKSSQFAPLTPSGSPLHDLFVAAGAAWNATTKMWKYGLLSDISTDEMLQMYTYVGVSGGDLTGAYSGFKARTNFIPINRAAAIYNSANRLCWANSNIEVFNLAKTYASLYDTLLMFSGCQNLRVITGQMDMEGVTSPYDMFAGCSSLTTGYIRNLHVNISLANSPLLDVASMKYLVDNAMTSKFPASGIIVTVHADVYAKLTDPSNTDWYAVNAAAQAKNISFATA